MTDTIQAARAARQTLAMMHPLMDDTIAIEPLRHIDRQDRLLVVSIVAVDN